MARGRGANEHKFYTVDEVAERLHVSRATALALIDSGELPAIDVSPHGKFKMRRVSIETLERFMVRRGLAS
jgi:excisionase family DNA binding protein